MNAIFLSASVPIVGRGNYHETSNPFLIQCAVRELIIAVIKDWRIVWGGHPAITPMIWAICQDLKVDYSNSVVLYQSQFFGDRFPEENKHFDNVIFVEAVKGDQETSLLRMRKEMLSRKDLKAAVFIGGMEGIEIEYDLFTESHPTAKVLPVASPGGAARQLAERLDGFSETDLNDVDFAGLFYKEFYLQEKEKRIRF
jgi:hypothetical protein